MLFANNTDKLINAKDLDNFAMTSLWLVNFLNVDEDGIPSVTSKLFNGKSAAIDYIAEKVYRDFDEHAEYGDEGSAEQRRKEAQTWLERVRTQKLGNKKQGFTYLIIDNVTNDTVYLQRVKAE